MVGVLITNAAGFQSVAYAPLSVTGVNSRPTITSSSPQPALVPLVNGQSQVFNAAANDADGDLVSFVWRVDGNPVDTGTSFTYTTGAAYVGPHVIDAIATDSSPLGGSTVQDW